MKILADTQRQLVETTEENNTIIVEPTNRFRHDNIIIDTKKFTPKEQVVLRALISEADGTGGEFGYTPEVWSIIKHDMPEKIEELGLTEKSMGGVIASLVKKDVFHHIPCKHFDSYYPPEQKGFFILMEEFGGYYNE